MKGPLKFLVALVAGLMLPAGAALANKYSDTVSLFENAGQSAAYFHDSYAYAVFPTIGKGGFVVGGAHGNGHVYEMGKYIGNASMTQVRVFFQDKRALDEFTSGQFEFDAGVSAVAITAAASGSLGTDGASGAASGGKK